jgi:hypothetical protein
MSYAMARLKADRFQRYRDHRLHWSSGKEALRRVLDDESYRKLTGPDGARRSQVEIFLTGREQARIRISSRCFAVVQVSTGLQLDRIATGYDLIPVAIARHPAQAIPLAGSWFGSSQDYVGMSVNVAVHNLGDLFDPSESR